MIPHALWRFERVIDKCAMHRSATVKIGHQHAFVCQCGTDRVCPDDGNTYPSIVRCEERPNGRWEKPLSLVMEHLTLWMRPWNVVFDPFLGSGTTSVVAKKLGRKYVGIEIDEKFASISEKRLAMADQETTIQGFADGVFWERNSL